MPTVSSLAWPMLVFVVTTTAALGLRVAIRATVKRGPTRGPVNGAISAAIQRASLLWCVALGLYAANEVAVDVFLPLSWYTGVGRLLEVVVVLSVTVILAGISSFATACVGHVRNGAVNGFVQTTAFVVTLVAGALVVLSL